MEFTDKSVAGCRDTVSKERKRSDEIHLVTAVKLEPQMFMLFFIVTNITMEIFYCSSIQHFQLHYNVFFTYYCIITSRNF